MGTGKTVFARGFIPAAVGDPAVEEDVTSPTFLLEHVFTAHAGSVCPDVFHYDFFRLRGCTRREAVEGLHLDHALREAIVLVEWPDCIPEGSLPESRLTIRLAYAAETPPASQETSSGTDVLAGTSSEGGSVGWSARDVTMTAVGTAATGVLQQAQAAFME